MLFVLVLILGAVTAGVIAMRALSPDADVEQVAKPVTVGVLIAARELSAGVLLKDQDISTKQIPQTDLPEGAIIDDADARIELRGALLRRFAERGKPITRDDVLRLHDRGFLAAVLTPGSRAISVGVDVVTGASGLIWPGDRVDVILVQELEVAAGGGRRVSGETILTAVRVIAVDQQLSFAAPGSGPSGGTEGKVARTVALEVTPAQAERLAVAERLGRVALTVRAIDQPEAEIDKRGPVYGADVSAALAPAKISKQPTTMRVFQGGEMQEVQFR